MNPEHLPQTCVLCGASTLAGPIETHHEFTLWQCSACAGRFWMPFRNPGAEWYEQDVRYHGRNEDPLLTPVKTHRLFLEDQPSPGGKVLDAGCGTGNFLAAAQKAGYQVYGVDFDRDAIQVARQAFQLEQVRVASVEDLAKEPERYDCVTFFEVLEHLDQPNAFLQTVRSLLRPNGFIALSVPDADSWDVFKNHDKPPRHLSRWTKRSMRNFLERNGFIVQRMVQVQIPLAYLITKFHFWTGRYLSFGLVEKTQKMAGGSKVAGTGVVRRPRLAWLKFLARAKDYILFTIPAIGLWIYLFLRGRTTIGLYVLARRTDESSLTGQSIQDPASQRDGNGA